MLNGKIVRLSDFFGKKNVVLQFGCSTCPPFIDALCNNTHSFSKLYEEYNGKEFNFFIIYTRETHPGEVIRAHRKFADKEWQAKMLKDEYNIDIPIIIDDLKGTIHKTFGIMPNMVYVIDKYGTIVYRSEWFEHGELKRVLDQITQRRNRNDKFGYGYSESVRIRERTDPNLSEKVYLRAGKKALQDAERVFLKE